MIGEQGGCMLANFDNKQRSIDLTTLTSYLSRSWLKKETTSFNASSLAITNNGQYFSGLLQSRTHLLDVPAEHAALAVAVSHKDPHVKEIITVIDGEFVLNPIVVKILVDHVRRTNTPLSYHVYNKQGDCLFSCDNINTLFYTAKPSVLEKIAPWEPRANSIPVDPTQPIEAQLQKYARQGMETHFSGNTTSCYGAAVLADNTIYFGGVYSAFDHRLGLHAEMVAAISAFADGKTNISHIGIMSSKFIEEPTHMCGCCRQFFIEIQAKTGTPIQVTAFSNDEQKQITMSLDDALPHSWTLENNVSKDSAMKFPLIDAFVLNPKEGKEGKIAICTNMVAPQMVASEIPEALQKDIFAFGRVIVNRDGAERMIINTLSNAKIEYLILFGEESLSFCPSTNVLLSLMFGYDTTKTGNAILHGRGISSNYPSVPIKYLDLFRDRVHVLPIFKHKGSENVIEKYLQWIEPRIPKDVFTQLQKIHSKKKIYFDSLRNLVSTITKQPASSREIIPLDPKDFQHLQPPVTKIDGENTITDVPFEITNQNNAIVINIDFDKGYTVRGNDSWQLAYSIMEYMNQNNFTMDVLHQLLLGVELSRIEMEIKSETKVNTITRPNILQTERTSIPLAEKMTLKADKIYYYKFNVKEGNICVQSLTHDNAINVFELQGKKLGPLIQRVAQDNRFEDYEQQFLHRIDVGIEMGRAAIALEADMSYFQDFRDLFRINKETMPLFIIEGDEFLQIHQNIIKKMYTKGLTTGHPDNHKGLMRSGVIVAVYRRVGETLKVFPRTYASGSQSTDDMREQYKKQLLSPDNQGSYTYGSRTRVHFGFDQLEHVVTSLRSNPTQPCVIQRFDFVTDMVITETPVYENGQLVRTTLKATHDPCLTHDIYFIANGKLYSFHIARAHNLVNSYPENIFGLFDAYDTIVSKALDIPLGDMFMLSSRGNILLLTEEQKAKKIIAEPSNPMGDVDQSIGPYDFATGFQNGVGYHQQDLAMVTFPPMHPCLPILENYNGVNLIDKATRYLKLKGNGHNNTILGTYDPRTKALGDAQNLIFFQCNQRGGKLHATVVFLRGSSITKDNDIQLCNYIATKYAQALQLPLGKLFIFYVTTEETNARY